MVFFKSFNCNQIYQEVRRIKYGYPTDVLYPPHWYLQQGLL